MQKTQKERLTNGAFFIILIIQKIFLYSPLLVASIQSKKKKHNKFFCSIWSGTWCWRRDFLLSSLLSPGLPVHQSKKKKKHNKFFLVNLSKMLIAHARAHARGWGGVYGICCFRKIERGVVYMEFCFLNSTRAHTHAHARLPYIIYAREREGRCIWHLLFSKKSRNTIDYKIKALYNNGATTRTRI